MNNYPHRVWKNVVTLYLVGLWLSCLSLSAQTIPENTTVLRVGTRHVPPFAVKQEDGTWDGIAIELWRRIAAENHWRFRLEERSLPGLLQGLQDSSLDVVAGAVTVTAQRESLVDFSHPFHSSGLGIAVSKQSHKAWLAVLERFASWGFVKVLLGLCTVLFLAGALVWIFERKHNIEQFGGDTPHGLGSAFWWAAVTMTTVGYGDKAPRTLGGRLVALIWMFTAVLMVSSFTAAIAASLTVGDLEGSVRNARDLSRVRVATVAATTSEEYLQERRLRYVTRDTAEVGLVDLAEGKFDALLYDAPVLRYFVTRLYPERLEVLPGVFERQYYALVLAPSSPLREDLNRSLMEVVQQSTWDDILNRYLGPLQ
ncbi:transporter substrate-binding domain-containing protein [Planctomycetota bacterium]